MERTWDVIRRYGTQSVMKVGLNQPIMREVLGKLMSSAESDVLTQSVTKDSADNYQITRKQPVKRAKKGLKRLKSRVGRMTVNQRMVKSVVASLAKVSRPNENGQVDCEAPGGGEKEHLIPPMLLAGLISTVLKSKMSAQTLTDTKLGMEVISQCGSGRLDDYKPSRTNMARMKLEGQLSSRLSSHG